MKITPEMMMSNLREWLDDTYSGATIQLSKTDVGTLLNRIEAQAARIAEQQAVINQRNGECDRLINELAARQSNNQITPCQHKWISSEGRTASGVLCSKCGDYSGPAPVAVPDAIKPILSELRTYNPKADEYGGKHIIPGWADRIEKALRLNSGGKPQRFVVRHPDDGLEDCRRDWPETWKDDFDCGYNYACWRFSQEITSAGGEIAE